MLSLRSVELIRTDVVSDAVPSETATLKDQLPWASTKNSGVALVVSSILLVGMVAALHASMHAYATASESASTHSGARLVMQRLLALIRTSTLHEGYDPTGGTLGLPSPAGPFMQCTGIRMITPDGQDLYIYWEADQGGGTLGDMTYWWDVNGDGTEDAGEAQVLLPSVEAQVDAGNNPYIFTLASRSSTISTLLARATVDLLVQVDVDATLEIEAAVGATDGIRLVASTMPRKTMLDVD